MCLVGLAGGGSAGPMSRLIMLIKCSSARTAAQASAVATPTDIWWAPWPVVYCTDGQGLRQRVGDVTPSLVSKPGGAGHALMFRDQVLVKKDFKASHSSGLYCWYWLAACGLLHACMPVPCA